MGKPNDNCFNYKCKNNYKIEQLLKYLNSS